MQDSKYWIWLSKIEGLNPKLLYDLIEKYNNPKILWNKTKDELIKDGIKELYADRITNDKYKLNLNKYLEYMEKNNIEIAEFTPIEVKQMITGYGRASKDEVAKIVAMSIKCNKLPKLDDTVDSIAIALCCSRSIKSGEM